MSDSRVIERWPIAPASWRKSTLWAGAGTLLLVVALATWRFWSKRKAATISPTPPTAPTTPADAAEASHAKT